MLSGSKRAEDMKAEEVLGEFLDRFFYTPLQKENKDFAYFRKYDIQYQYNGVDVLIERGKKKFFIDEKAALYYSNMMIPTFAFEIESIQKENGVPVKGWFVNNSLNTTHYVLIWPNIKCEITENNLCIRKSLSEIKYSDFTIVEAMLISKKAISDYLESFGFTDQKLVSYAKEIRQSGKEGKVEVDNDNLYFFYSKKIAEQPINLVVKKQILFSLAQKVYLISQDGMARIK